MNLEKTRVEPKELVIETSAPVDSARGWLVNLLVFKYGFPNAWITDRIKLFGAGGFFLLAESGVPFLAATSCLGDYGAAEKELLDTLAATKTVEIGVATDGTIESTRFLKRRFVREGFDYIPDLGKFRSSQNKMGAMSDEKRLQQVEMPTKAEGTFFEAHSHIRDIDGLHADEALDELCKIILLKLVNEKTGDRQNWFDGKNYGTQEEQAATLRSYYASLPEHSGGDMPSSIGTSSFRESIKLSAKALVRVADVLKDFNFSKSSTDIKGQAFQKVLGSAARSGMGQYLTPDQIIKFMCRVIHPGANERILDPFCGSAHFLTTCAKVLEKDESLVISAFSKNLHGIEKNERMVRLATIDAMLSGITVPNIRCADSLLSFDNYADLEGESFDLILTNPPFGSLLNADAISQLGQFELGEKKKSSPLEILGLERCIQFLRPGGRMGIVLPDGVIANKATRFVRNWVDTRMRLLAVVSLPVETFAPFGANVKTSILFMQKREGVGARKDNEKILLYKIENIGYDAAGRERTGSEIEIATEEVGKFLLKVIQR